MNLISSNVVSHTHLDCSMYLIAPSNVNCAYYLIVPNNVDCSMYLIAPSNVNCAYYLIVPNNVDCYVPYCSFLCELLPLSYRSLYCRLLLPSSIYLIAPPSRVIFSLKCLWDVS